MFFKLSHISSKFFNIFIKEIHIQLDLEQFKPVVQGSTVYFNKGRRQWQREKRKKRKREKEGDSERRRVRMNKK